MARVAATNIVGKVIGPIGYGLMGRSPEYLIKLKLTLLSGFCRPWAPVEYSVATEVMKTALEQGSTFWNAVSTCRYSFTKYNR